MSAGGFYGKGIYFAEHARYSNDYFNVNAQSGEREMLLVLVAVGRSKEFQQQLCRELNPAKDLVDSSRSTASAEVLFDSVCGGPHCPSRAGSGANDSKMHVVYNDSSIYPAYKVTYRPRPKPLRICIKDEHGDEFYYKKTRKRPPK